MRRLATVAILAALTTAALTAGRSSGAPEPGYSFRPVAQGFGNLTYVTAPANSADLYVVERTGKVWVLLNGTRKRPDPFADFSGIIRDDQGDNGLLSIAFSPNYGTTHLFYVDYTAPDGNIRVDEFRSDGQHAIMSSQRHILAVFDPIQDHYGGQLQFGLDGKLYVSVGDGGCCGDPLGSGQPMSTFLGKLLSTATPTAPTPTWTIVANGLRNPWRFSFDRQTGDLYLADVGQDAWEEVDYRPRGNDNANFGWSRYEGNHDYNTGVALQETLLARLPDRRVLAQPGLRGHGGLRLPRLPGRRRARTLLLRRLLLRHVLELHRPERARDRLTEGVVPRRLTDLVRPGLARRAVRRHSRRTGLQAQPVLASSIEAIGSPRTIIRPAGTVTRQCGFGAVVVSEFGMQWDFLR